MCHYAGAAVAGFAATHRPRPVGARRLTHHASFLHTTGANRFLHGGIHRVELVVPGDDLVQLIAVRVPLENDEVMQQIEETLLLEDATHD